MEGLSNIPKKISQMEKYPLKTFPYPNFSYFYFKNKLAK